MRPGPVRGVSDRSRCTNRKPDVKWLIYAAHYKRGEAQEIDQSNYRIKHKLSSVDFRWADVDLGLTCGHIVTMKTTRALKPYCIQICDTAQYMAKPNVCVTRLELYLPAFSTTLSTVL